MNKYEPQIKGIHTGSTERALEAYSLGQKYTLPVDSSNGFFTSELNNLSISGIAYTAPTDPNDVQGSSVVTFSGSPDLSEVMVKNMLKIQEADDFENIGLFEITAIDNSAKTITIKQRNGKTNASMTKGKACTMAFFGAYAITCLETTSGLTIDGSSQYGELTKGITLSTLAEEVKITTSGKLQIHLL